MPEDDTKIGQVELKQRAGQKVGEFIDEIVRRVVSDDPEDEISMEEWYQVVSKLMSIEPRIAAFLEVLDYCKLNSDFPERKDKTQLPKVFHPSRSAIFKRTFLQNALVNVQELVTTNFKDIIFWGEMMTAHRKPSRRRISSLEDAF